MTKITTIKELKMLVQAADDINITEVYFVVPGRDGENPFYKRCNVKLHKFDDEIALVIGEEF